MSDTYSESLCIERLTIKNYRLFLGGYEFLGEVSDFVDDETGEENIPEMIGRQKVQDYDGQYIYGGSIVQNEDDGEIVFQDVNDNDLHTWLKDIDWHTSEILFSIRNTVKYKLITGIVWHIRKILNRLKNE